MYILEVHFPTFSTKRNSGIVIKIFWRNLKFMIALTVLCTEYTYYDPHILNTNQIQYQLFQALSGL